MCDTYLYNPPKVSARIKAVAKMRGVSVGNMLSDIGLGVNALANMNHGKAIAFDRLARIADYLDCSVDYLMGRTESVERIELSEQERKLIEQYRVRKDVRGAVEKLLDVKNK